MKIRRLFVLLVFLTATYARAEGFTIFDREKWEVKQGEVFIVQLGEEFKGKNVYLRAFENSYYFNSDGRAFVGVDFRQNPGNYSAYLLDRITHERVEVGAKFIKVVENEFPTSRVKPKPGKKLTPEEEKKFKAREKRERIRRLEEDNIIAAAYNIGEKSKSFLAGKFKPPLKMMHPTSKFGTKRFLIRDAGDEFIGQHPGVDLMAGIGTSVRAVNAGRVALVTERNFVLEGTMVIIDHGLGLFTIYMHLSKIKIKKGQTVNTGDIVGKSGDTGKRVTGPHLHFAVKIGRAVVDPMAFMEMANKYLE